MNAPRRLAALVLLGVAATATAGTKVAVQGEPFQSKSGGYAIEFPAGWKCAGSGKDSNASRDGYGLDAISVEVRKHKNAFRAIKKGSSEQALPQELAELLVDDIKAQGGNEGIEVLASEPAELGGRPAFRLHLRTRVVIDVGALDYEQIIVGTATPDGLVLVAYRAPSLHYFAAHRQDFETALASFRFEAKH